MTIHLPPDIENLIEAAVECGRFASWDDAMIEAASLLVQRLHQEQGRAGPTAAVHADTEGPRKPIWERILERSADVPENEWEKLPTDFAEQHDHYLYGTPKRPMA